MGRRVGLAALAGLVALLGGCATAAQRMDRLARSSGLEILTLPAGEFRLRAYAQGKRSDRTATIHVYLEGDGMPWIAGGRQVARDPHGEHHLAFELMRQDPSPSIYLKRPCYQELGGAEGEGHCHPLLWTHQRYSATVVESMEAALRWYLDEQRTGEVVWLGYSGGGVLAMLLAPRFPETTKIVTVAANLDVAAWAERHGYTPLTGSLDPVRRPPLPRHIEQLHLVGELDANVPPSLVRTAVAAQPGADVWLVEGFDHTCCWRDIWPEVLASLR